MSVSKRNRIQAGGGAGHHTANVEVWEDFLCHRLWAQKICGLDYLKF